MKFESAEEFIYAISRDLSTISTEPRTKTDRDRLTSILSTLMQDSILHRCELQIQTAYWMQTVRGQTRIPNDPENQAGLLAEQNQSTGSQLEMIQSTNQRLTEWIPTCTLLQICCWILFPKLYDEIFKFEIQGSRMSNKSCFGIFLGWLKAIVFLSAFTGLTSTSTLADVGTWLLFDADSGRIINQKDANRKWYPASLTKMMTSYVIFKAIRQGEVSIDSSIVFDKQSVSVPPSKMGFRIGTRLTIDDALKMLIVKSANDVAVALANSVGGSEQLFVSRMNQEAARLGMVQTNFANPHGLPNDSQVTSARDIALLARALWLEFPEYRDYYSIGGIKFNQRVHWSSNKEFLTRVRGASGIKTGFICNSGYNLAAVVERDNRTLIAIIMGAGTESERLVFAHKLMDAGFRVPYFSTIFERGISDIPLEGNLNGPPEKGYCWRNKPKDSELLAHSSVQKNSTYQFEDLLSEFSASGRGNSIQDTKRLKLNGTSKGIDQVSMLDTVVGPKRSYEIVVKVGVLKTTESISKVAKIPLPRIKPLKTISPSTQFVVSGKKSGGISVRIPKLKPKI